MTNALEFIDINFGYGPVLFKNLSFKVPQGEFLVVIGPNGGGKSTIIKLALGLLKPSSGKIFVQGKNAGKCRDIGYVPQKIDGGSFMPATVTRVVSMGRIGSLYKSKDMELVEKAIDQMNLKEIANRQIASLSLGQRQRVLIARALASNPKMLFLDEPIASVDPESRQAVLSCLKNASKGRTVIVISHDYSIIPVCATAVACVNRDIHYHSGSELTQKIFNQANCSCPVEIIGHGLPHRVLETHHD